MLSKNPPVVPQHGSMIYLVVSTLLSVYSRLCLSEVWGCSSVSRDFWDPCHCQRSVKREKKRSCMSETLETGLEAAHSPALSSLTVHRKTDHDFSEQGAGTAVVINSDQWVSPKVLSTSPGGSHHPSREHQTCVWGAGRRWTPHRKMFWFYSLFVCQC